MKRNIYLNKLSLVEAQEKFEKVLKKNKINLPVKEEWIFTENSLGRITAKPVFAKISSPHYQAAAMDGVVVKAKDTYSASETYPIRLKINKDFYFINTGNPIPVGFDAVIKIEDINPVNNVLQKEKLKNDSTKNFVSEVKNITEILIFLPAFPGQHVRNIGEDIVTNQLIISVNKQISSIDIGVMLAGGVNQISVRKKPKVAIIPTGDELIQPDERIAPGKIIEYNSKIIKGLVLEWGGDANVYEIVRDIAEDLKKVLLQITLKNDIVVIIAGSSAGSKDFTAEIIKKLGEVIVHGIAISPGKPTILGIVNKIPCIGIPGYPVSAVISAEQFLKPLIFRMLNVILPKREKIKAHIAHKVVSRLGDEEFLRVKLGKIGDRIMAYPLSRGAGIITSLAEADGITRIPSLREGLDLGEEVYVELWKNLDYIINNIIVTGSHDLILDILRNELQEDLSNYNLVSFNVGSMGGLLALKHNSTHCATTHLLDPETGEYNFPFIEKILSGKEWMVVNLTYREQGIIIQKSNPKSIGCLKDLTRKDIKFINRQKGSGTRILLDYLLRKEAIVSQDIKGYFNEEFSHLMVASAIANGIADAGLGILSAALAFKLDFIPLAKERYDIIIRKEWYSSSPFQKLLGIIKSENFKKKVLSLGGYDLSHSGKVIER